MSTLCFSLLFRMHTVDGFSAICYLQVANIAQVFASHLDTSRERLLTLTDPDTRVIVLR